MIVGVVGRLLEDCAGLETWAAPGAPEHLTVLLGYGDVLSLGIDRRKSLSQEARMEKEEREIGRSLKSAYRFLERNMSSLH